MTLLKLKLADGRPVLVRADDIAYIVNRPGASADKQGCEIFVKDHLLHVTATQDEVLKKLQDYSDVPIRVV